MAWTDFLDISIHAPPRGATPAASRQTSGRSYFNSRPSARGDQQSAAYRPQRGNFNSRPSARGDVSEMVRVLTGGHFNSRPSARGDASVTGGFTTKSYFNSRPSARGDRAGCFPSYLMVKFQFTPLREGRQIIKRLHSGRSLISIHAPPRGATINSLPVCAAFLDFNSRPSARGDCIHTMRPPAELISIHAPPRGATAKDMQFLQIFCSTLTNQHGLTIMPRNLSRYFGNIS